MLDIHSVSIGILTGSASIAPLMNTPSGPNDQRHFSAFPLTSHLHTPTLRLVSLHPFLSLTVSFLRVPEIHDDFQWKIFIARDSTAQHVVERAVEELGLTKSLPVPGGGLIDYVLEEVWSNAETESECMWPLLAYMLMTFVRINSYSFQCQSFCHSRGPFQGKSS